MIITKHPPNRTIESERVETQLTTRARKANRSTKSPPQTKQAPTSRRAAARLLVCVTHQWAKQKGTHTNAAKHKTFFKLTFLRRQKKTRMFCTIQCTHTQRATPRYCSSSHARTHTQTEKNVSSRNVLWPLNHLMHTHTHRHPPWT